MQLFVAADKIVCPDARVVYIQLMASTGVSAVPGEIFAGRYRIEQWVGQGNMGVVYRATHLCTGRECALKLVHADLVEQPDIEEMFVQEARVGGLIGKNPYIVDVFDAGVDSNRGVPFLAMDLLEGMTLDKYITRQGRMPPGLLKILWQQLADALEQAHAAGVVHRDLKPGNLFLTCDRKGNPQLRVVDFGIAKLVEEGVERTATPIGTPAYAAPEQLGNALRKMARVVGYEVSSTISRATDIWALGVITYEMLSGAPAGQLWVGENRVSLTDLKILVATEPVPSATARARERGVSLPPGFDAWLERCLEKNADDRWPSADLAVQHLLELLDGHDWLSGVPGLDCTMPPKPKAVDRRIVTKPRMRGRVGKSNRVKEARTLGVVAVGLVACLLIAGAFTAHQVSPVKKPKVITPDGLTLPRKNKPVASAATPDHIHSAPRPEMTIPALAIPSLASPSPLIKVPNSIPSTFVADPALATSSASLRPEKYAVLSFHSNLVCIIVLDGLPIGQTPIENVSVAPGEHTVAAFYPEKKLLRRYVRTLNPAEQHTVVVHFD